MRGSGVQVDSLSDIMEADDIPEVEAQEKRLDDDGCAANHQDLVDQEMVEEWAATEIQRAWRRHSKLDVAPTHSHGGAKSGGVCCACFTLLSVSDVQDSVTAKLFCSACRSVVEHTAPPLLETRGHASPAAIASPLPKLSQLMQTEAKYREQLKLLRQQQEILDKQREQIERQKQAKAEAAEVAKLLARERRKQFNLMQAKRAQEETHKLQEMTELREQAEQRAPVKANPPKPRSKTPTPESADKSKSVLDPAMLQRHRIPPPVRQPSDEVTSKAAELAERATQEHRRKQKQDMMKLYAQDLTPLVHGQKPKQLPLPTASPQTIAKKAQQSKTKPTKPTKIHLMPIKPTGANVSRSKKPETKESNQQENDLINLRVQIPTRLSFESMYSNRTPLTAEIKPVAWMYELLRDDATVQKHRDVQQQHTHVKTQLTTLLEDEDDHVLEALHPSHPQASVPTASILASQRVQLAPLSSNATPVLVSSLLPPSLLLPSTSTPASAVLPTTTVPLPREYTSERLASLLEKYKVSVSTSVRTTTTTSLP